MKAFISSVINGMLCYWVGLYIGRNGGFGRVRACVNIFRNGDAYLRASTVGDDISMFTAICIHLENEGYIMDGAKEAFTKAIEGGSPLHEEEE